MRILYVISIVIFTLVITSNTIAQVSGLRPQRGDWLCWANNPKTDCGTYGWHKQKLVALKAAIALCNEECEIGCEKEYCEKLK